MLLFFKYVSDKYKGEKYNTFKIPEGASFDDLIALKGKPNIGENVDKILDKFLEDNKLAGALPDVSFNSSDELGHGKELVDKVSGLISIFENPMLDFRNNRANGDDIIGDAYEYFMMKFAQESGKSKGQFYTPSEVSRVLASLIGINKIHYSRDKAWTLYDPAAGSGSLLIKAADKAPTNENGDSIVTIYGQEYDTSTAGLAKMNLILHNKGTGEIERGNTLATPKFLNNDQLKKFDFIVMNPPFSDKDWASGIMLTDDKYHRFDGYGIPPEKNGDYAWFLHVLASLNRTGKAGIVLPHGVLFRGNSEASIRKRILEKKYIKGIVGLPANLFYGTGIPACLILIDKEDAASRDSIFMIDASDHFAKKGDKNRLREQDIKKIIDTYNTETEIEGYSRKVSYREILNATNNGNLNIPRYITKIDNSLPQNIEAHLKGGIPELDIDSLKKLWKISPSLREQLFQPTNNHGLFDLAINSDEVENFVLNDPNIARQIATEEQTLFNNYQSTVQESLENIGLDTDPKNLIDDLGNTLLQAYDKSIIIDNYGAYDELLKYWGEKLQDDVYVIKFSGYEAARQLDYEYAAKKASSATTTTGKGKIKSFDGYLIPKSIIADVYFQNSVLQIDELTTEISNLDNQLTELLESQDEDNNLYQNVLNEKSDSVKKNLLTKRIKELSRPGNSSNLQEELQALKEYQQILSIRDKKAKDLKSLEKDLDDKVRNKYPTLSISEIKDLLFHKKWMRSINTAIKSSIDDEISTMTNRLLTICKRYEHTLGELQKKADESRKEVVQSLERMGYKW